MSKQKKPTASKPDLITSLIQVKNLEMVPVLPGEPPLDKNNKPIAVGKESPAFLLVYRMEEHGIKLFLDKMESPRVAFPGESGRDYPVRCPRTKAWLEMWFSRNAGVVPRSIIADVLSAMEAVAFVTGVLFDPDDEKGSGLRDEDPVRYAIFEVTKKWSIGKTESKRASDWVFKLLPVAKRFFGAKVEWPKRTSDLARRINSDRFGMDYLGVEFLCGKHTAVGNWWSFTRTKPAPMEMERHMVATNQDRIEEEDRIAEDKREAEEGNLLDESNPEDLDLTDEMKP